jgi:hypothetical protein
VPHPSSDLPGVVEYRQAMKRTSPEIAPEFISLEGFLLAKTFVEAARRVRGELTREAIVDAFEQAGMLDVGIGVPLTYSRTEHQGSHHVWLSVIRGGSLVPFEW